jgi:hypothetical protein
MKFLRNIASLIGIVTLVFVMGKEKGENDFVQLVKDKCSRMEYLKLDHISYRCKASHQDAFDFQGE